MTACPGEPVEGGDEVGGTSTHGDDETTASTTDLDTDDESDSTGNSDSETGDPECGNGIVDAGEDCDDGNAVDDDGCSNACTASVCGNGILEAGEGCDAGADNGPGMPCNSMCQPNVCGDGEVGPGEGCDDGNTNDDDECSNTCTLQTCGNGQLDLGEECDDGNTVDMDACLNSCVAASCGDGFVFEDEACDQGALNSDTSECTAACQQATCGDGLIWNGLEECDLGPGNGSMSACLDDCVENVCGDGFQGPLEGCDDGNLDDDDGCSASCELESCGDGMVQAGEACDDGNAVDTDDCTTLCEAPACGDGFLQAGEACDQGNGNTNGGQCTLGCLVAECGDGFVYAGVEQCDNGGANSNDASCKADCTDNFCGDGFAGPGESCDDGNANNADGCTNVCTLATCGDGIVQAGEQCDDDNMVDADGCTNMCTLPACGDDIVQAGEQCDDGDVDNTDDCTNSCHTAVCGDGFIQPGIGDECDDGNLVTNDGCSASCVEQQVVQISGGRSHSCAVLDTGAVRCWGDAIWGKLGYGNLVAIGDNEHPFTAGDVNIGGTAVQVVASYQHSCALLNTGVVRCWGYGALGALGYGNTVNIGDNEAPVIAGDVPVGVSVVQLVAGESFTCALLQGGAVRCWGQGVYGKLGYGNTNDIGDNESPASAGNVNVGGTVTQLAAGDNHVCALLDTGAMRCWGRANSGQLGYGNTNHIGDNETPASAGNVDVGGSVVEIAAGREHTCARFDNGSMRCWGLGSSGRLGYGNITTIGDNETPATTGYVIVGGPVVGITAGAVHTCARLDTSAVRCWGNNGYGHLGYGNIAIIGDNELPATAGDVNFGGIAVQLEAGDFVNHVILPSGALRSWGYGLDGQLGYASTTNIGDNELPFTAGNVQIF